MKQLLSVVLLTAVLGQSTIKDLDGCVSDLDSLRIAADEAKSAASDAETAAARLKRCRNDRGVDCDSETSRYKSALNALEDKLDDLSSRVRSVGSSCGVDFTQPKTVCDVHRKYINRLPLVVLMDLCKKNSTEAECKACLARP